jgi:murein DD-endopeptidase MepM/ murein hydrolase activator NlpD
MFFAIALALIAGCESLASQDPDVGCPGADYPDWDSSPYVLPYPVGVENEVNLSNCSGSFHSDGTPDAFATDFAMPVGTHITASRAGTVVRVIEHGNDFGDPNNLVVVDHGDGTYAQYMHLTRDGALVDVGVAVEQGDTLGLSGATGLAGYPHLHFVVTRNGWSWPYSSIPVTFSNTEANPRGLRAYTSYRALEY